MSETEEAGISTSELAMWRCLIGMVHADRNGDESDCDYLYTLLKSRPLSAEQYAILEDDLVDPKDIDHFLGQIDNPHHRTELVNFARMLAWQTARSWLISLVCWPGRMTYWSPASAT